MFSERCKFYEKIEKERNTKVISYITGDRPGLECQIAADTPDIFLEHLDHLGKTDKITLILYTCGGDTLAAWNIISLFREFCQELEILVPNKCRSAGTLMSLGANTIIMTKQATLGPIDPSIIRPMSPIIPGSNPPQKLSLSVESVKGYFSLLKNELKAKNEKTLSEAFQKLAEQIHPVVLGDVYRTQKQIQMLATKLLSFGHYNKKTVHQIVSFLCSDSGSHDYTISRTEAKKLGLHVESPSLDTYNDIKAWYADVVNELELKSPFIPEKVLNGAPQKQYCFKRCLIESVNFGQDAFVSEGILFQNSVLDVSGNKKTVIGNNVISEGWRHF